VPQTSSLSAHRERRPRMLGSVLTITTRGLAGLMILVIWGVGCSQPRDLTAAVMRAPRIVDSLLWKTPAVARFFIKVLGDSQTVNYRGFALKSASRFTPQEFGAYKLSSPPKDSSWVYCPNRLLAALINQGGDPDKELWLYNQRREGRVERLADCGTPCDYRGLFWLDNRRLVFVQTYVDSHQINDSTGAVMGYTPIVTLYDIAAESAFTYVTTPIPVRPSK